MVGRPICSSVNTITHNASKILDKRLQSVARQKTFYVKDSDDFLLELEKYKYNSNSIIMTCDVIN